MVNFYNGTSFIAGSIISRWGVGLFPFFDDFLTVRLRGLELMRKWNIDPPTCPGNSNRINSATARVGQPDTEDTSTSRVGQQYTEDTTWKRVVAKEIVNGKNPISDEGKEIGERKSSIEDGDGDQVEKDIPKNPTQQCGKVFRSGLDAPWALCQSKKIKKQTKKPCLILSFGSDWDFDFEVAMLDLYPNCDVWTFDPSMELLGSWEGHLQFVSPKLGIEKLKKKMEKTKLETVLERSKNTTSTKDMSTISYLETVAALKLRRDHQRHRFFHVGLKTDKDMSYHMRKTDKESLKDIMTSETQECVSTQKSLLPDATYLETLTAVDGFWNVTKNLRVQEALDINQVYRSLHEKLEALEPGERLQKVEEERKDKWSTISSEPNTMISSEPEKKAIWNQLSLMIDRYQGMSEAQREFNKLFGIDSENSGLVQKCSTVDLSSEDLIREILARQDGIFLDRPEAETKPPPEFMKELLRAKRDTNLIKAFLDFLPMPCINPNPGSDRNARSEWKWTSLQEIVEAWKKYREIDDVKNGDFTIPVLRLDIDGDEWRILEEWSKTSLLRKLNVRQVSMETHFAHRFTEFMAQWADRWWTDQQAKYFGPTHSFQKPGPLAVYYSPRGNYINRPTEIPESMSSICSLIKKESSEILYESQMLALSAQEQGHNYQGTPLLSPDSGPEGTPVHDTTPALLEFCHNYIRHLSAEELKIFERRRLEVFRLNLLHTGMPGNRNSYRFVNQRVLETIATHVNRVCYGLLGDQFGGERFLIIRGTA